MLLSVGMLMLWVEKGHRAPLRKDKSQYFLGNSKQSAEKEYFYFFNILLL